MLNRKKSDRYWLKIPTALLLLGPWVQLFGMEAHINTHPEVAKPFADELRKLADAIENYHKEPDDAEHDQS